MELLMQIRIVLQVTRSLIQVATDYYSFQLCRILSLACLSPCGEARGRRREAA